MLAWVITLHSSKDTHRALQTLHSLSFCQLDEVFHLGLLRPLLHKPHSTLLLQATDSDVLTQVFNRNLIISILSHSPVTLTLSLPYRSNVKCITIGIPSE